MMTNLWPVENCHLQLSTKITWANFCSKNNGLRLIWALQTYQTNQRSKTRQLHRHNYFFINHFHFSTAWSNVDQLKSSIFWKIWPFLGKFIVLEVIKLQTLYKYILSIILKPNTSRFGPNLSRHVILTYLYLPKNQEYVWY